MIDRRGFLAACGVIFVGANLPKLATQVDDCGGFLVPKEFEHFILDETAGFVHFSVPVQIGPPLTIEEVCRLRGVPYRPEPQRRPWPRNPFWPTKELAGDTIIKARLADEMLSEEIDLA